MIARLTGNTDSRADPRSPGRSSSGVLAHGRRARAGPDSSRREAPAGGFDFLFPALQELLELGGNPRVLVPEVAAFRDVFIKVEEEMDRRVRPVPEILPLTLAPG